MNGGIMREPPLSSRGSPFSLLPLPDDEEPLGCRQLAPRLASVAVRLTRQGCLITVLSSVLIIYLSFCFYVPHS